MGTSDWPRAKLVQGPDSSVFCCRVMSRPLSDYTDAMQAAEIELKFAVAEEQGLRAAAERLGFQLVTERTFEENTLYDTPERRLRAQRQILRLRQYGNRCTVTHKRI